MWGTLDPWGLGIVLASWHSSFPSRFRTHGAGAEASGADAAPAPPAAEGDPAAEATEGTEAAKARPSTSTGEKESRRSASLPQGPKNLPRYGAYIYINVVYGVYIYIERVYCVYICIYRVFTVYSICYVVYDM